MQKEQDIVGLKNYILKSIDHLIGQLQSEQKAYFEEDTRFSLDVLHPDLEFDKMSKMEITAFQRKHGIKVGDRILVWSEDYKKEVISNNMVSILASVIGNVEMFRSKTLQQFDFGSMEILVDFLKIELAYYHNLLSNHEGRLYYDSEYRKSTNSGLKHRFDAIWFINEQNDLWDLNKERLSDRNSARDTDYPFVLINLQQWIDYETSFRLLHLIKGLRNKGNNMLSQNLTTKSNDIGQFPEDKYYSEIFKDLKAEEVFNDVLEEFDALDRNGNAIKRGFQGVCEAFFSLYKEDITFIKRNATTAKFIDFLRSKYKAIIKSDTKLSDGSAYRSRMKRYVDRKRIK
ncbi:hypothetical protein [Maribacter luteus]|uniref:Uncharacterized protein n=1 Tax=Maribacter luteus TaxID=2594478 RepID=A0A6I2MPK8_9FLAO|nr:hypothetical protein [Maribacter luteus]MRX65761.1 hypothetical protein [Maribacter luteus]